MLAHSLHRAACVLLLLAAPAPALAARFVVNSTADTLDALCAPVPSGCTLRDAVSAAVNTAGADTIAFDPAVFPFGTPATITLATPLPQITDPAGTIVDGTDAGVVIDGSAIGPADVLVIASGAGAALTEPAVENVTVRGVDGEGVLLCGGVPPDCEEDVSDSLVRNVVVVGEDTGINVSGRANSGTQVIDSAVVAVDGDGIRMFASLGQPLSGARVQRCRTTGSGIQLRADGGGDLTDVVITDVTTIGDPGAGMILRTDGGISKMKLTNVALVDHEDIGIIIDADESISKLSLTGVRAEGNEIGGIEIGANGIAGGITLKDVGTSSNGGIGISIRGSQGIAGLKATGLSVTASEDEGIFLNGGSGAAAAKITRARVAGSGSHGILINAGGSTLKQVEATGNAGDGIVLADGGGHKVEKSTASGNGGNGIEVGGNPVTIQKNVALGNGGVDLEDQNASCGPNVWKKNTFAVRNQPCIE
jgi:CSLREA domain-containing protein